MTGKPWTDTCKIETCKELERRREEVAYKKALRQLSKESGIPQSTINYWYTYDYKDRKPPSREKQEKSTTLRVDSSTQQQPEIITETELITEVIEIPQENIEEKSSESEVKQEESKDGEFERLFIAMRQTIYRMKFSQWKTASQQAVIQKLYELIDVAKLSD